MIFNQTQDRRREKGIERRKEIIDAAIKCIATRGLCDTTLDRVSEIAKVSKTLVIFHFKSKKGMLEAVLEEISSQYNKQWSEIIAKDGLTASMRLLELIAYDVRLPIEKPDLLAVWHTFWGEAKGLYKELNYARDERYSNDMKDLIQQLVDDGGYKNINAELTNSALVAILFGLWWNAHLNPSNDHFEHSMDVIQAFLQLHFPKHY